MYHSGSHDYVSWLVAFVVIKLAQSQNFVSFLNYYSKVIIVTCFVCSKDTMYIQSFSYHFEAYNCTVQGPLGINHSDSPSLYHCPTARRDCNFSWKTVARLFRRVLSHSRILYTPASVPLFVFEASCAICQLNSLTCC